MLVLAMLFSAVLAVSAAEKVSPKKAKTKAPVKKEAIQYGYVTGSRIKQPIRRDGWASAGTYNVVSLDSKMIERSGSTDLRQLIAHYGAQH